MAAGTDTAYSACFARLAAKVEALPPSCSVPAFAGASRVMSADDLAPYQALRRTLDNLRRRAADGNASASAILKAARAEEERLAKLDRRAEAVRGDVATAESKLKQMEARVSSKTCQLERQKAVLEAYSHRTLQHLGLELAVKEGQDTCLILCFSGLCKDDPESKCVCEVYIEASGEYRVGRTLPELGDDDATELQRLLRETNDLSGFVATLRKRFKSIIELKGKVSQLELDL